MHKTLLTQTHSGMDSVYATPPEALAVVEFWRDAGPQMWFAKDKDFDELFRERFMDSYKAAAIGALSHWNNTPDGALAMVILLDQFPRNSFRGTSRMYATDSLARATARQAVRKGFDRRVETEMSLFFYLPFGHSEDIADQELSVSFNEKLGEPNFSHAKRHRDIVRRFGRFPHRNPILNRTMKPEEQQFLDEGGYAG